MATTNIQSFSGDVEVASDLTVTANLTVDTNTLHVDSVAGRVGIGKTNPAYAVDVNGTVNATALYVGGAELQGSPWSSNNSNTYYTTGAVGIGTDFPKKNLEVQGALRVSNAATGSSSDFFVTGTDSGGWSYQDKISNPETGNFVFGTVVSMSGDGSYAIAGEYAAYGPSGPPTYNWGAAHVFVRSGTSWTYQAKLTEPSGGNNYQFGHTLDISSDGTYAIVASKYVDKVYVFTRNGTSWSSTQTLTAPDFSGSDRFGQGLAMSGDGSYAIIGAYGNDDDGNSSGSAYIYVQSGGSFTHQAKFTAPDGYTQDQFGDSVHISSDGTYAIAGARYQDSPSQNAGAAYIWVRSGTNWTFQQKLSAPDAYTQDQFGSCTRLSGDGSYAVVGAIEAEGPAGPPQPDWGAAYVFVRSGTNWTYQAKLQAPDGARDDFFAADDASISISSDGQYIAIGSKYDDDNGLASSGSVYIWGRSGTNWTLQQKLNAPDPDIGDNFGESVSLSSNGAYLITGARSDDDNGNNSGAAFIYKGGSDVALNVNTPIQANDILLSFTGQHICFPEGPVSQGLVVSANKNKYVSLNGSLATGRRAIKSSESLPVVSLSNVASDRSAFGVVDHFESGGTIRNQKSGIGRVIQEKEFGDNRVIVNSLGEGAMWVANTNGLLESGDYITTSNIVGYGQKQDDDTLHSYTVAKITMDCDFEPEDVPVQIIKKDENGQNILDQYGRIQWEDVSDQTEKEYRIRYLTTDGRVTDQANAVWKAAYVGCTYHCG